MELLKLLSTNEILAQVASFLFLLLLMRLFAWKKILGILDARQKKISDSLQAVEDAKVQVARLKGEYDEQLANIEMARAKKIQEAMAESREITDEARKRAHLEALGIINTAKADLKFELLKAKEEMKGEIIDLTMEAVEKIIGEKLTEADDKKMVKDFLDKIDKVE